MIPLTDLRVISIWQPYASLAILGHKKYETRGWPAPTSLIGQRIGIASTKVINYKQIKAFAKPNFQKHFQQLDDLEWLFALNLADFWHGHLLGTVKLDSCHKMTRKMIKEVGAKERAFGDWKIGRYAWSLVDPKPLKKPIPVRGQQGVWIYR